MVTRRGWQKGEQRIAEYFGTHRTPLSGGDSRLTRSDTLHPRLFIEVKHRQNEAAINLWDEAKEETKQHGPLTHVMMVVELNDRYRLVHSDDLLKQGIECHSKYTKKSFSCITLYEETAKMAEKENKIPVVCFNITKRPGFWLLMLETQIPLVINEATLRPHL